MNITQKRTDIILNILSEKHYAEYCSEYGESGYQNPESGIIFCNWNNISQLIQDYLELAGYNLEWSDEWYIDYNYNKAWRTSPDSYSWVRAIAFTDAGEVITPDDSVETWVEYAELTDYNQPIKPLPDWIADDDLITLGYTKIDNEFESGFYGTCDNPKKIAKQLFEKQSAESVVFKMDYSEQFRVGFSVFYKQGALL